MVGASPIVSENVAVDDSPSFPVTCTSKPDVPAALGVPLSVPPELIVIPAGGVPLLTLQVYGV